MVNVFTMVHHMPPNDNTTDGAVLVWVALRVLDKLLTLEMKGRDLNQCRVHQTLYGHDKDVCYVALPGFAF